MTDNVVQLPGAPNIALQPVCADTIAILQTWLDKAKRGEVHAVAVAAVGPTRWTSHEWGGSGSRNDIVASVAVLQARMLHSMICEG